MWRFANYTRMHTWSLTHTGVDKSCTCVRDVQKSALISGQRTRKNSNLSVNECRAAFISYVLFGIAFHRNKILHSIVDKACKKANKAKDVSSYNSLALFHYNDNMQICIDGDEIGNFDAKFHSFSWMSKATGGKHVMRHEPEK